MEIQQTIGATVSPIFSTGTNVITKLRGRIRRYFRRANSLRVLRKTSRLLVKGIGYDLRMAVRETTYPYIGLPGLWLFPPAFESVYETVGYARELVLYKNAKRTKNQT
jgi:hypothetical protein